MKWTERVELSTNIFDLGLSSNGTFNLKVIQDITGNLNDYASDAESVTLDKVRIFGLIELQPFDPTSYVWNHCFYIIALKSNIDQSITENESTTADYDLDQYLQDKLSQEFTYQVLQIIYIPRHITAMTETPYSRKAIYAFNAQFVPSKRQKQAGGGCRDNLAETLETGYKMAILILHYSGHAAGYSQGCRAGGMMEVQYNKEQRSFLKF